MIRLADRRTPTQTLRSRAIATLVLAGVAIAGCTPTQQSTQAVRVKGNGGVEPGSKTPVEPSPASNLDPCALRLHDLCGSILLYYFTYQRLPAKLEDVNETADVKVPFVCPTTNQPYVYTPDGILLPERGQRILVYDGVPHGNYRWAIRMKEAVDNKAMVLDVISLDEQFFLFRPSAQNR